MKNKTPLKLKKLSGRVLTTEQLNDVNGGFVIVATNNVKDAAAGTCGGATCQASCSSCNSCVWWTCGDWSCAGTHCFC